MEYNKSAGGAWIGADDVKTGDKIKLVTECAKQDSKFKDKDGNVKTENVAKARVQGADESKNIRINWTSIYGLIDAHGKDSKEWIGKVLTVKTLDAMVGDTMRTIIYLIPEGFDLVKNEESKMEIRAVSGEKKDDYPELEEGENPNPDDIPF